MNGAAPPPDRSAFMRLIGAAQVPAPPGKVHVRLPHMREELLNQLPAAHGGVIMTLLDSVMSRAAGALPGAPSQTAVTVEMTSRFHRPGRGALLADRERLEKVRTGQRLDRPTRLRESTQALAQHSNMHAGNT